MFMMKMKIADVRLLRFTDKVFRGRKACLLKAS